jgi:hypothetical protein
MKHYTVKRKMSLRGRAYFYFSRRKKKSCGPTRFRKAASISIVTRVSSDTVGKIRSLSHKCIYALRERVAGRPGLVAVVVACPFPNEPALIFPLVKVATSGS